MKLFEDPATRRLSVSTLLTIVAVQGGMVWAVEPAASEAKSETKGLIGDWCREKKRRITHYSVNEGELFIRGGRSGRTHRAALTCNETYTECVAQTIRGWGTPVTETLRRDGENMNLTRVWGGAWKGKTYNFTFVRCPKW